MRKLLSSLGLLFAAIPIFAQFSGSGSGTENSPYLIYNETQLAQVANFLGQEGVVFSLQKDLDVSNYISENYPTQGWLPIGNSTSPFKGVFYGNGHTISGLFINRSSTDYVGLFGYADGADITRLTVNASYIKGDNYVGAIVGYLKNPAEIKNCSAIITQPIGISAKKYVGGIVGCAETYTTNDNINIWNCIVKGSINATSYVGGIVGQATDCDLFNIQYYGDINATETIGGIAGYSNGGRINNSYCKGNIVATGKVGGIVGDCNSSITTCFYQGKITNSGNITGGIVGYSPYANSISNSMFFGEISGVDGVGGIVGQTSSDTYNITKKAIDNCSAIGNISGHMGVGGIIGQDHQYVITNSYYNGILSGLQYVGGLVGYSYINPGGSECYQSISYCYSNATISGGMDCGGLVGCVYGGSSTKKLSIKSCVAINTSISATYHVGRIYGTGSYVDVGALGSSEGNRALNQTIVKLDGVVQNVSDNEQNGTGIGPSMLKLKANYVAWGWDFDNNWTILETECFPYKKYQVAPPKIESELVAQATGISGKSHDGGTVYLCYKDNAPVSTTCSGNAWSFSTEALQSGSQVQLYAETSSFKLSYYTTGTVSYPGGGTEEDPYLIYTAEDLQGATNSGYYKLMNDIDLTSWINANSPTAGWPAVGQNSTEPTHIDGCGHKVTGLWTNTSNDYAGLFSNFSASGSSIKNLTVEVATGKKVKGRKYTGILVGCMKNGEIINCSVKGDVYGSEYVGGLAGYLQNISTSTNYYGLNGVKFSGSVTSSGTHIGGLAGYCTAVNAMDCSAKATISSSGNSAFVGGIFGYNDNGDICSTYADVTITATGSDGHVGGLVGHSKSAINRCYAKGTVRVSGNNSYTGGLVGYSESIVNNCYATTNVTGTLYTAGLVGYSTGRVTSCYASGDVNGVMYGAGVVGELDGSFAKISNCVAANNIISLTDQSSWGSRVIGGFQNGASEPDNSNYALSTMQVSLNGVPQTKTDDNLEGIAKTQNDLMTASTYEGLGWNFSSVWGIDEGHSYPYLQWAANANPIVSITLDNTSLVVAMGETATIVANVLPEDAGNKHLIWTSSNESVATVDNGVVTAIEQGTAIITVESTDGSNVSAECEVTVVLNHDSAIAELQALVDQAQELYDNSTEGENIGEYATGSRAALLAVINSVKARISHTMDDNAINECTTQLNNAITQFESQRVTARNNTLYSGTVEIRSGGNASISLELNNEDPIIMVEFFMQLPEGISIALDEDGYLDATLNANRSNRHSIEVEKNSDGLYHFLVYSSRNNSFKENEGELINIKVECEESMEGGTYQAVLRNILLNDADKNEIVLPDYNFSMHVTDVLLGDVNGDWKINGSDIVEMVDHIMGRPSDTFILAAAELTGDGLVNGSDLVEEISLVMSQGISQAPASVGSHAPMLLASGLALNTNQDGEAVLSVESGEDYILTQMTLHLSEGQHLNEIMTDSRHSVEYSQVSADTYVVLCYSSSNSAFCSNNELLSIHYTGVGVITVSDVMMVGTDRRETYFAPVSLSETTGIEWASHLLDQPVDVYSINGYMVKHQAISLKGLTKGVYLINGNKVIIK